MAAMNDATCPKCGKRFGWAGEMVDRPLCPGCGFAIPREDLEAAQRELDRFQEYLLERRRQRRREGGD